MNITFLHCGGRIFKILRSKSKGLDAENNWLPYEQKMHVPMIKNFIDYFCIIAVYAVLRLELIIYSFFFSRREGARCLWTRKLGMFTRVSCSSKTILFFRHILVASSYYHFDLLMAEACIVQPNRCFLLYQSAVE